MHVFFDSYVKFSLILAEAASPGTGSSPGAGTGPGTGTPPPAADGILSMVVMFAPFIIIIYFFMIRPDKKRRDERDQLMNALKVKDKVVTIGGLHGTIVEVEKDEVVLLVDAKKDVKLRFRRSAIDTIESNQPAVEEKK